MVVTLFRSDDRGAKVILPAVASPIIAGLVAAVGTWLIYRVTVGVAARFTDGDVEVHTAGVGGPKTDPADTVLAWILFIIVLAGVALGITYVVATGFGKVMSFDHIYPTIHSK